MMVKPYLAKVDSTVGRQNGRKTTETGLKRDSRGNNSQGEEDVAREFTECGTMKRGGLSGHEVGNQATMTWRVLLGNEETSTLLVDTEAAMQ